MNMYVSNSPGELIHMWRFNESTNKLYISRSLLLTDRQVKLTNITVYMYLEI